GLPRPGQWCSVERAGVVVNALAGEPVGRGIPRKMNDDQRRDLASRRWATAPGASVGGGHPGDLDHSLGPDDNVLEVEVHVRKRAEKTGVKGARPSVTLPALTRWHDFVDALLRQGVDQAGQIARIFGLRMVDPQTPNGLVG